MLTSANSNLIFSNQDYICELSISGIITKDNSPLRLVYKNIRISVKILQSWT